MLNYWEIICNYSPKRMLDSFKSIVLYFYWPIFMMSF